MTDQDTMIERVAFVLFRHWRDGKEPESVTREVWVGLDDAMKATWFKSARAAIEAMRSPTEAMALAGFDMLDREVTPHAAEDCWRAMISAALNPGEGE